MKPLTENYLKGYDLAQQSDSIKLKNWWNTYIRVREFYDKNRTYNGIAQEIRNWNVWSSSIRRTIKNGNPDRKNHAEKYAALKEINFPFKPQRKAPKAGKGKHVERALKLHKIFNAHNEAPDKNRPLSKKEEREYNRLLGAMKSRAKQGQLAIETQEKLGLIKPEHNPPRSGKKRTPEDLYPYILNNSL